MDKVQELISKMTKDLKVLLDASEVEMNNTMPLLEKEGKQSHIDFIKETIADAKNGGNPDVNDVIRTFNNLK
jgi:hypothetical protein